MTKGPDSNDLAARRTEFAEDRNIMAMERTFAGWLRTAFAAIAIGLACRALFGELQPPWLAKAIATLFITAGAALAWAAQRRARQTLGRLDPHEMEQPSGPNFRLLAYAVIVGSAILVAGLWLFNDGNMADESKAVAAAP